MPERQVARIERELMDEPHIAERRVSVRQIHALVEERGLDPEAVVDRYDLDMADVYHALAYHHDHLQEMRAVRKAREETFEKCDASIERPEGVAPDDE